MKYVNDFLVFVLVFAFTYFCTGLIFQNEYDSTDNGEIRSGLVLKTDHLTGCQYLSSGLFGNITPRLNAYGKQICEPTIKQ